MPFTTLKQLGNMLMGVPNQSSVDENTLFPLVSHEEDGIDCDKDCEACPGYGRAFEKHGINTSNNMFGGIKGFSTHVIVATGETDWIRDVQNIKGSCMKALGEKQNLVRNGVG